jgi:hypothetical protein
MWKRATNKPMPLRLQSQPWPKGKLPFAKPPGYFGIGGREQTGMRNKTATGNKNKSARKVGY